MSSFFFPGLMQRQTVGQRPELSREPAIWWTLTGAFFFMFVLVLAANLFADAVRDAFDPRLQER